MTVRATTPPTDPAGGPNAEQAHYWNEVAGDRWAEGQARLDARLDPFGHAAMDATAVRAGEDVLDVGCGCGSTSLELGRRVEGNGSVLGLDLSAVMLDVARRRNTATHVRFERGDAQIHPLRTASVDLVFSRFGVMFFADPAAAFANSRRALRPGGRLTFVCWQGLEENPWFAVPMATAARHVAAPPPPPPGAPGPLALADADLVRDVLRRGGFARVEIEPLRRPVHLGDGLEEAVGFLLELGPAARLLREADAATRARVADDLRDALAPLAGGSAVELGSAAWIVTAR